MAKIKKLPPTNMVCLRSIALTAAGLLVTMSASSWGPAVAQDRLPLQELPLETLDAFDAPGDNWQLAGQVQSDRLERHDLQAEPGQGVLVNLPSPHARDNLFTAWTHGDMELELQFMMPKGSNSGIYLQGRYEIQLLDSWGKSDVTFGDLGGVYHQWDEEMGRGFEGRPPRMNASRAPGLWQTLRIVFQAPVFDESGQKIRHARFTRVELNGSVVQENVTVTGPTRSAAFSDEAPVGPLMIQGDHGPIAFRHIRYKAYGTHSVAVSELEFREFHERFDTWPDDLHMRTHASTGIVQGFSEHQLRNADPMAISYAGQLHIPQSGLYRFSVTLDWITGDPHFSDTRIGGALLSIDGHAFLDHDQNDPYIHADVHLDAGSYPFSFAFFKSVGWRPPNIGLSVEGPGTPLQWLRELDRVTPPPPIFVDISAEPAILRGFIKHQDTKRTHTVAVGDPSGVHYSLDLATGALLHAWRGPFADVTQMWHNRGHNQLAIPLGSTLSLSGSSFLLVGDKPTDELKFTGYNLDPDGRPQFLYRLGQTRITDIIRPDETGQYLIRTVTFEGASDRFLRVLAASHATIEPRAEARYAAGDGSWYIESASDATIHPGHILTLPVVFNDGQAEISYAIVW